MTNDLSPHRKASIQEQAGRDCVISGFTPITAADEQELIDAAFELKRQAHQIEGELARRKQLGDNI